MNLLKKYWYKEVTLTLRDWKCDYAAEREKAFKAQPSLRAELIASKLFNANGKSLVVDKYNSTNREAVFSIKQAARNSNILTVTAKYNYRNIKYESSQCGCTATFSEITLKINASRLLSDVLLQYFSQKYIQTHSEDHVKIRPLSDTLIDMTSATKKRNALAVTCVVLFLSTAILCATTVVLIIYLRPEHSSNKIICSSIAGFMAVCTLLVAICTAFALNSAQKALNTLIKEGDHDMNRLTTYISTCSDIGMKNNAVFRATSHLISGATVLDTVTHLINEDKPDTLESATLSQVKKNNCILS